MNEAVVAGAVAGAIAGVIAGAAVVFATQGWPWRRAGEVRFRDAGGGWVSASRSYRTQPGSQPAEPQKPTMIPNKPLRASDLNYDELFDASGRRVVGAAAAEAMRIGHNYIGTEHLLLGVIVADADGPAGRVLTRLGVSLDKTRTAVEFIIGKGEAPVAQGELTVSPRARRVFDLAVMEARALGRQRATAADVLLGLVREGQGIASGILESLGVQFEHLRQAVIAEMNGQQPPLFPQRPAGPAQPRRGGGPFDRFSDRAKRILALAQDEAIRMNHNYIGPEHMLLGILREGEGIGARVLLNLGAELSAARRELERLVGRGESTTAPTEITLAPRTKKLIDLAIDEAQTLGHGNVASEHLLLGAMRDEGSNFGTILGNLGVDLAKVRPYVLAMLANGGAPPPA